MDKRKVITVFWAWRSFKRIKEENDTVITTSNKFVNILEH